MALKKLLLFLFTGILLGCGTSSKTITPTEQSKLLDELVLQKSFQIESISQFTDGFLIDWCGDLAYYKGVKRGEISCGQALNY